MPEHAIYDRHKTERARAIANGVALIIMGFSLSWFFRLLPNIQSSDANVIADALDHIMKLATKDLVEADFGRNHILASLALVTCIVLGLIQLNRAREDNDEFIEAYPQVRNLYSPQEKAEARALRKREALAGIGVLVIAALTHLLLLAHVSQPIVFGTRDALVAVGTWLIVHGCLMGARTNVYVYDFAAIRHMNVYELEKMPDSHRKTMLLSEKRLSERLQHQRHVIWTVAVLVALALYFLPTIETPFYWLALVAGGIVDIIATRDVRRRAIAALEHVKAARGGQPADGTDGDAAVRGHGHTTLRADELESLAGFDEPQP